MSWKSFASLAVALGVASAASAVPTISFVNNANSTGTFRITPDASLLGAGGSVAFELQVNINTGGPAAATVGSLFPTANPGGYAYPGITFTGGDANGAAPGLWNGLNGNNSNTIRAAFGSNLFTTGAAVDALTIDLPAAGTLTYFGVLAQAGVNTVISSTNASITNAPVTNPGDFNGDGRVDSGDLSLLLSNWGAAVPPVPSGWTGAAPTAAAIDSDELSRLLGNWGFAGATAVPEPAAAALAMLAGLVGLRRRGC